MDEIYKCRLAAIKREEEAVRVEEERVSAEKQRYVRLLKRVRDEDCSRFSALSAPLAKRYVLLGMLGKGGFSEVFKVKRGRKRRFGARSGRGETWGCELVCIRQIQGSGQATCQAVIP